MDYLLTRSFYKIHFSFTAALHLKHKKSVLSCRGLSSVLVNNFLILFYNQQEHFYSFLQFIWLFFKYTKVSILSCSIYLSFNSYYFACVSSSVFQSFLLSVCNIFTLFSNVSIPSQKKSLESLTLGEGTNVIILSDLYILDIRASF